MFYLLIVFNCSLKEEKNKIDENVFFIQNQRNIWSETRLHVTGSLQECYFDIWIINFYSNLETIREKKLATLYFEEPWALNLQSYQLQ